MIYVVLNTDKYWVYFWYQKEWSNRTFTKEWSISEVSEVTHRSEHQIVTKLFFLQRRRGRFCGKISFVVKLKISVKVLRQIGKAWASQAQTTHSVAWLSTFQVTVGNKIIQVLAIVIGVIREFIHKAVLWNKYLSRYIL